MGSTLKRIEEKLRNIAHHRFMELQDCRGKRMKGEVKGSSMFTESDDDKIADKEILPMSKADCKILLRTKTEYL
jgi:hypothetical protein